MKALLLDDIPRPRVLFIGLAAFGVHGGIQRFNRRIVQCLERMMGHTDVLMLADSAGEKVNSHRSNVTILGAGGRRSVFLCLFLRRLWYADVLLVGHINLLPFAVLFRLLRPRARVILFAHGIEVWGDPTYRVPRTWEPPALKWAADKVAIVSGYSRDLMAKAFHLPLSYFDVFPNAVDPLPGHARSSADPGIISVARLASSEREKNVDKLICAMPEVLKRVPNAVLTIVGDGALRTELEELARHLKVEGRVSFRGFVNDEELQSLYQGSTVFALPSSKEGFGIVYLEAWARGLPVIASCYGAAPEVVTDGLDGFTVDPADVSHLAERLVELLSDARLAQRMARAGREKINELYSGAAFEKRLFDLCLS